MKKLVSIVLALALVLAVATAFAGSISITPPSNNPADAANSYEIYKVFDGVGDGNGHISYTLMSGKTAPPTGFELDSAGNIHLTRTTGDLTQLTTAEIEALEAGDNIIAGYEVYTVSAVEKEEGSIKVTPEEEWMVRNAGAIRSSHRIPTAS